MITIFMFLGLMAPYIYAIIGDEDLSGSCRPESYDFNYYDKLVNKTKKINIDLRNGY